MWRSNEVQQKQHADPEALEPESGTRIFKRSSGSEKEEKKQQKLKKDLTPTIRFERNTTPCRKAEDKVPPLMLTWLFYLLCFWEFLIDADPF